MLRYSLLFLVIALIAGALGLFNAQFIASEIAWVLFVVFLILFVVSLVMGRRAPPCLSRSDFILLNFKRAKFV
jgi:uncharacterized membrane protein YtjA (UPF0391 family)